MITIILPIFLVILIGFIFGKKHRFSKEAEGLINTYVLFVALPALLFLSVAQAKPQEILQTHFIVATLLGIAAAYWLGMLFARANGVSNPKASIIAMASCYGTTGYMGIPILLIAFGSQAAVPAAIATILHNIPAIMAVIITHDIQGQRKASLLQTTGKALATTIKNPLTLAVILGVLFSVMAIPLPDFLQRLAEFLSGAAGPTALFALGIGLSQINVSKERLKQKIKWVMPVIGFKVIFQPLVTLLALIVLANNAEVDIWFITAVVMAAQPIGAGVYVFAHKYEYFSEEASIAIVLSLLVTLLTLAAVLNYFVL